MRILVSGATATMRKFCGNRFLGALMVPDCGNRHPSMLPWAADNGAFAGFNEQRWRKMLLKHRETPGCLWATAPDVVADCAGTLAMFPKYEPEMRELGYSVAYVAQDGATPTNVPWQSIECLFIGGSTGWKLSKESLLLIQEAKARGKMVHVGRVNTIKRLRWCYDAGADTVDGTGFSMFPDTYIPRAIRFLESLQVQQGFAWKTA